MQIAQVAQNGQFQRFPSKIDPLYLKHLSRSATLCEIAGLQKQTAFCNVPSGIFKPHTGGVLPVIGCCPCNTFQE